MRTEDLISVITADLRPVDTTWLDRATAHARYLPDRGMHQVGDALAALGASPLPLGRGATDVVDRKAARKALNLSRDPDQIADSRTRFWQAVENAIRSAGLPFRSMQVIQKDGFVFWDSSRLVRVVFTISGHGSSRVGAVVSTAQASRRAAILPFVVRSLRGGQEHSSADYELDRDDGLVARLCGFDVHKEDGWSKACHFVTDYLTQVRHGLYDARANLLNVRASRPKGADQRRHRPHGTTLGLQCRKLFGSICSDLIARRRWSRAISD